MTMRAPFEPSSFTHEEQLLQLQVSMKCSKRFYALRLMNVVLTLTLVSHQCPEVSAFTIGKSMWKSHPLFSALVVESDYEFGERFPDPFSTAFPPMIGGDAIAGLSTAHMPLLFQTQHRQSFATGSYPLRISLAHRRPRNWLHGWKLSSISAMDFLVNGTSVSPFDRFLARDQNCWQQVADSSSKLFLEFLADVPMERPCFLRIIPARFAGSMASFKRKIKNGFYATKEQKLSALFELKKRMMASDRLWVTSFSLTDSGGFKSLDVDTGSTTTVSRRSRASMGWPNEISQVPASLFRSQPTPPSLEKRYQDALLVADGFLVPGKDRGGLYIVKQPGNPSTESTIRLSRTSNNESARWFYHRATWVDMTLDGRQSILAARCRMPNPLQPSSQTQEGQLVWLECPMPHSIDPRTGKALDQDGKMFDPFDAKYLPWKEHVLASGPDVMLNVADLDANDDCIEVMASEFFGRQVTLHSIELGPSPRVVLKRTIDSNCGAPFACILAQLDGPSALDHEDGRLVVDSGSTIPTLKAGDNFSHLLVTSHERLYKSNGDSPVDASDDTTTSGGSLFAYRVPKGKDAWKTKPWTRTTIATGFKVQPNVRNMINPGAPGFVYTFHAKKSDMGTKAKPLIAVAGDCAESAYIFRPSCEKVGISEASPDPATKYKLMIEISCGATVGSLGIGYNDFMPASSEAEHEPGCAKLYVPCYEDNRVLVFAIHS